MKTFKNISGKLLAVIAIAVLLFTIADQAGAQTAAKPKGKPWPAPDEFVKMKNPNAITDSTLINGKDLYTEHCKSCHGSKGKGDGPKAEKIDISCGDLTSPSFLKETDGEIFWKTTEGRKPMPSFNEKLSDKERWDVVVYVRSLGKAK
jgi:mono/diheme cytochrome c family protein